MTEAKLFSELPKPVLECLYMMLESNLLEMSVFVSAFPLEPICQSPIEDIFYKTYLLMQMGDAPKEFREFDVTTGYGISCGNKTYYPDFLAEDKFSDYKLVIECDGHEFHSSKEQIAHDNERNRTLILNGYDVIHFSGSEIYKEPAKCVADAWKRFRIKSAERRGVTNDCLQNS